MRWRIGTGASAGTVTLYQFKSAMGSPWIPVAREGLAAIEGGLEAMGQARSTQASAIDEDDAGALVTNLYKELVLANYIWANQANRTEEDDPLDTRDVGDQLADEVTLVAGTTDDYYVLLQHYKGFSIQFIPDPAGGAPDGLTQLKIYASNQDDGTAPNALDYTDVTSAWFGAPTITVEQFLLFDLDMCAYAIHIELTRDAGVGDEDYTLRLRRNY